MANPIIQRSRIGVPGTYLSRHGLFSNHKWPDISPLIEKLISCATPIQSSMQISSPCIYICVRDARRNFIQLPSERRISSYKCICAEQKTKWVAEQCSIIRDASSVCILCARSMLRHNSASDSKSSLLIPFLHVAAPLI